MTGFVLRELQGLGAIKDAAEFMCFDIGMAFGLAGWKVMPIVGIFMLLFALGWVDRRGAGKKPWLFWKRLFVSILFTLLIAGFVFASFLTCFTLAM